MRAERESILRKLKIARGQIEAILRMVNEDAYCVDISNQLLATQSLIKNANQEILKAHIHGCVKEAFEDQDQAEEKVEEALHLLERMS